MMSYIHVQCPIQASIWSFFFSSLSPTFFFVHFYFFVYFSDTDDVLLGTPFTLPPPWQYRSLEYINLALWCLCRMWYSTCYEFQMWFSYSVAPNTHTQTQNPKKDWVDSFNHFSMQIYLQQKTTHMSLVEVYFVYVIYIWRKRIFDALVSFTHEYIMKSCYNFHVRKLIFYDLFKYFTCTKP